MNLWPRLPLSRARAIARQFEGASPEDLRARPIPPQADCLYAPTGGAPVPESTLRHLRRSLEDIAKACGYPSPATRRAKSDFDTGTLRFLADYNIPYGEAIRPETWAWVTVALTPHLVHWRWPEHASKERAERYAGSLLRNAFGRLWYASVRLDRGPDEPKRWLYTEELGADQVVALLERPSLAASQTVSLAVAGTWVELPQAVRKEEVFREAMKTLIVKAGVQRLEVLSEEALRHAVRECFESTITRMGIATATPRAGAGAGPPVAFQ